MLARALADFAHPKAYGPGRSGSCLRLALALALLGVGCADRAPPADWPEPPPPVLAKPIEGPSASGTTTAAATDGADGAREARDAAVNNPEDGAAAIDAGVPEPTTVPDPAHEEAREQSPSSKPAPKKDADV